MKLWRFFIFGLCAMALAACGGQASPSPTPPASDSTPSLENTPDLESTPTREASGDSAHPAAQAVVNYLQARVEGNADAMRELTCAEQESQVAQLALSFQGRDAQLVDVVCAYQGEERATCTGSISASYQGEARNFPVPNYRVLEEDGVWRVCGETE